MGNDFASPAYELQTGMEAQTKGGTIDTMTSTASPALIAGWL